MALEGHGDSVRDDVSAWALDEVDQAARLRRRRLLLAGLEEAPTDRTERRGVGLRRLPRLRPPSPTRPGSRSASCTPSPSSARRMTAGRSGARSRLRRCRDAGASPSRRSTASAIGASAGPWSGCSRANRTARSIRVAGDPRRARRRRGPMDPYARRACDRSTRRRRCPTTTGTLSEIERMLVLRKVALFSGLAPEDLQRIAASAVEQALSRPTRRSSARASPATSSSSSSRAPSGSSMRADGRAPAPDVRAGRSHR